MVEMISQIGYVVDSALRTKTDPDKKVVKCIIYHLGLH